MGGTTNCPPASSERVSALRRSRSRGQDLANCLQRPRCEQPAQGARACFGSTVNLDTGHATFFDLQPNAISLACQEVRSQLVQAGTVPYNRHGLQTIAAACKRAQDFMRRVVRLQLLAADGADQPACSRI